MSNVFVIIKMFYVHNQWYDILSATLYVVLSHVMSMKALFLHLLFLNIFALMSLTNVHHVLIYTLSF